jgi:CHAT domain-containing protein/tetratricopeptide (TPR) repeat protein
MLKLATVLFCLLLSAGAAAAGRIGGITTYNDPVLDEIVTRAEDGDVSAMTELGDQFRLGTETRKPDLARALEWYEKAAAQNDINAAYFSGVLLTSRGKAGDLDRAREYYDLTARLCEAPEAGCTMRIVNRERAVVYRETARYEFAIKLVESALAESRAADPPDDQMIALLTEDLGIIQYSLGQYDNALASYHQAENYYVRLFGPKNETVGNVLLNQGNALERLNRFEEAVAAERRSLEIMSKALGPSDRTIGFLHNNIGWSLKGLGRYDDAYAELSKALPILKASLGPTSDKVTYTLTNLGIVREKQNRHREAIALNMKALVIMKRLGDVVEEPKRWTYESLSNSYRALGDRKTAILFAKLAVNTQQRIRSLNTGLASSDAETLAKDWLRLYQSLADLLIEDGRPAEAQYVLNLVKQQELIEFVRRDAAANAANGGARLSKSEASLDQQLEALMDRPMAIAAEFDALNLKREDGTQTLEDEKRMAELEAELDQSYEDFVGKVDALLASVEQQNSQVADEVSTLNLEFAADMQEQLRNFESPTVILQAVSFADRLHLFLTTKETSVHREVLVSRADLARKVFDAITAIEDRSQEADTHLAALYELLIKPLEQDLDDSGAEVIMLNLGGFLRYLPFAALKSENGYLIERYALSFYTPAAQTRFETAKRSRTEAAGFGVTAAHQGFSPLPGVAKEMEAIFEGQDKKGELVGSPNLDAAFTEEKLREVLKQRPKLLHVASHFRFVPGNETDSFLLLGDGAPLSLEKIRKGRGFRLGGVDLITLSACETAKGSDAEGDEVESFGAIAQMNGASAVMATLWPIADEASGKLMADFYRGLVDDGLSKATALRRAQLAMLRNQAAADVDMSTRSMATGEEPAGVPSTSLSHPYYWSPFILMGNWM